VALDPISAALDIGGKVIDRLWPDPAQRAAAQLELLKLQQSGELAQIAVNVEEAKSASVFVAGWRPAIGWVAGAACAWNWIGLPVAKFALALLGHPLDLAPADLSEMMPVLMGMLGLGAMRTAEKFKGVARS
jgi:Holin of 3TMs, for gene-transfer release